MEMKQLQLINSQNY